MQQPRKMLRIMCVFSIGFDFASFAWTAVSCLILHRFVIIFHPKLYRVMILPLKVDFTSMLILSFVFFITFWLDLDPIWGPFGRLWPSFSLSKRVPDIDGDGFFRFLVAFFWDAGVK